jgi:hypothetical protein
VFAFLATHRSELFPDQEFADLFPSERGRPSLTAPVAASILTLQSLYDLSDSETAAARCDLRWTVEAQERVIGRTKLSDIELDPAVKPPDSHVARTTITEPDGTERQILRDNLPFGTVGRASSAPPSSAMPAAPRSSSGCRSGCS